MHKTANIILTAAATFGAGLVTGLLFSPNSGEENRKRLAAQIKTQTANLEKQVKDLEKNLEKLEKQIVESSQDLKTRVKDVASKALDQYVPSKKATEPEKSWSMDRTDLATDLPRMPKV